MENSGKSKEALLEAARKQNERDTHLTSLLGKGDKRGLGFVKAITKETFLEAVQENMDMFGVSREEAKVEVVKEFKIIGINIDPSFLVEE